jgi:CRP/FNR family transcriptional regulator, anaerobic regulatory protein
MDALQSLRAFSFYSDLAIESKRVLQRGAVLRSAPADRVLVRKGDHVAGAYLVVGGALRVYNIDARGRETTLYWIEPGDSCVLALNCLFADVLYPAWVQAERPSRIVVIDPATYIALFASDRAIQRFTFDTLAGRVFELMTVLEEVVSSDKEQRLANLLVRKCNGQRVVAMSQARMAAHLGTAREVVTRILRQFEAKGLVRVTRGSTTVLDSKRLVALADDT